MGQALASRNVNIIFKYCLVLKDAGAIGGKNNICGLWFSKSGHRFCLTASSAQSSWVGGTLSPFYGGNQGSERLSNLLKVAQLNSSRAGI